MSNIEWTGKTWNPIVGCSKISAGCANCYAIQQAHRNAAMAEQIPNPGRLKYYEDLTEKRGNRVEWTGLVRFVPEALEIPLKTKKPTTWFVNSMSDFLHESVTFEILFEIASVMLQTPQHTYQILTKRADRLPLWASVVEQLQGACNGTMVNPPKISPLPNLWLGVTVENQKAADERIPLLLQTPAAVRFLSCEPLLEEMDILSPIEKYWESWIDLDGEPMFDGSGDCDSGLGWVIVGGESGSGARHCDMNWIRSVVRQCRDANVPVFVKQLGSNAYDSANSEWRRFGGKNNDIANFPSDLQIREMPQCLHQ